MFDLLLARYLVSEAADMSSDLTSDFLQFKIAMPKGSKNGMYSFDRFKLDSEKLMLYRDEMEVTLPPKIVKTLAVLIENRGSILSKDELIEKVWVDSIVEESNLSQNLYILRKTLGSKPDGGPYIETLRRRGYRFTADVRSIEHPSAAIAVAAPEPPRPAPSVSVERQGNVLRLVDWTVREPPVDATIPVVQTAPAGKGRKPWYALGLVALLVIAASGAALYFYGLFAYGSNPEVRGELTVTRLTNMNYVRDATISRDGNFFAYNEALVDSSRVWLQQTGTSARKEIIPGGKWQICCKTFSPDGKFVYFMAINEREKRNDLYRVATLGGPPEKILNGVSGYVSFSPDGTEMLFLRIDSAAKERSLIIAASDGKGDERQILKSDETLMSASLSPDGKTVAFQTLMHTPDASPACVLSALDLATGSINRISDERWGTCMRMEWLRDGSGIAMVGTKEGETNSSRRDQVHLISYPGGRSRRLTTEGSRHEGDSLGVTDDGAILAVPYNRSSQIWGMDANGDSRTAVQLTSGAADGRASITPLTDGRVGYIARSGDLLNVWLMNADGSNQTQIGDASAVQDLAVTPDGRYFTYSNELDGGRTLLFRIGTDGTDPVQITSNDDYVIDSTVSPDGAWLVYDLWKTRGVDHEVVLKKVPFEGGEPVTLSKDDCSVPHFSPNGQYVSCVYFGKNQFAIISSADGAKVAAFDLVKFPHVNTGGRWTPDSQALAYIVHQNSVCNVWTQPIDGGKPQQLTDFTSGACYNLAFSHDGSRLYLARGHELRDAILITNYK